MPSMYQGGPRRLLLLCRPVRCPATFWPGCGRPDRRQATEDTYARREATAQARGRATRPTGRTASGNVTPIVVATKKAGKAIPVGNSPLGIAVTP